MACCTKKNRDWTPSSYKPIIETRKLAISSKYFIYPLPMKVKISVDIKESTIAAS